MSGHRIKKLNLVAAQSRWLKGVGVALMAWISVVSYVVYAKTPAAVHAEVTLASDKNLAGTESRVGSAQPVKVSMPVAPPALLPVANLVEQAGVVSEDSTKGRESDVIDSTAVAAPLIKQILFDTSAAAVLSGVDPVFSALIARCAPTVHPETMAAVISAESRGHQFAIADAGPVNLPWAQRKHLVRSFYLGSVDLSVAKAEELIASGHTVSLGISQINDRNLKSLGLSIKDVFDPCTNIAAGGKILTGFYQRAVRSFGPGPIALRAALSGYNSGDWLRGDRDGYVDLVYKQVGRPLNMQTAVIVPKIDLATSKSSSGPAERNMSKNKVVAQAKKNGGKPDGFLMSVKSFEID